MTNADEPTAREVIEWLREVDAQHGQWGWAADLANRVEEHFYPRRPDHAQELREMADDLEQGRESRQPRPRRLRELADQWEADCQLIAEAAATLRRWAKSGTWLQCADLEALAGKLGKKP